MASFVTWLVFLCCVYNNLLWLRVAGVSDVTYKPCYLDYCYCWGTTANCSHNGNNLHHIPRVNWPNITTYYFTYNNLSGLRRASFGAIEFYDISVLDLQGNNIQYITKDAFLGFPKLYSLTLSKNVVPMKDLSMAFSSLAKGLSYLYLNQMNLTTLPDNFFDNLTQASITGIHMSHNDITEFNMSVFIGHPYVTTVELDYNRISSFSLVHWRTLGSLWLGHNSLNEIPDFCHGSVVFPQLWNLGLQHNNITLLDVKRFECLNELRRITFAGNNLSNIFSNSFSALENLKTLDISKNKRPIGVYKNAFSNNALVSINLSSSLDFIDAYAFNSCFSLNTVDLSNSRQSTSHLWSLLVHLKLKTFVCKNCQLDQMPDLTKKMPNLEVLLLDANHISIFPNNYFVANTKLRNLSLSSNNLQTVGTFAITYSLLLTLKYLNLANNPFKCDCRILWLKNLLMHDTKMFHDQWSNYKCALPVAYNGQRLVDVGIVSDKVCKPAPYTTLFCTVGMVLVVTVVAALLYKWRWNLRYCFMTSRSDVNHAEEASPLLQNDAYVVYCQDDYHWIRHQVMPNLEERGSLKLRIKQRDFDQNVHMVDNIVDNLRHCKKALVVMSNSFLRDNECQFELTLVRKKMENRNGCLILVLLEDIEDRYRSQSLDELMTSCPLLIWRANSAHCDAFWKNVKASLRDSPLQAVV